jgi:glucose-6-phosphate 1-epimerase
MKLSLALIAAYAVTVSGFSSGVPIFGVTKSSSSTSALFDSRKRQKIASRTEWAEKRGYGENGPASVAEKAGLMTNEEGLEYVKLVHPDGASSEIYLFGGDVTSYKDAEGVEYIAVRPDAKMDGSKPISGGLSHCWPQVSQFD